MRMWYEVVCPNCGVNNWLDNGEPGDVTSFDLDGFQCWNCNKNYTVDGEETSNNFFCGDPLPLFCTAEDIGRIKIQTGWLARISGIINEKDKVER